MREASRQQQLEAQGILHERFRQWDFNLLSPISLNPDWGSCHLQALILALKHNAPALEHRIPDSIEQLFERAGVGSKQGACLLSGFYRSEAHIYPKHPYKPKPNNA